MSSSAIGRSCAAPVSGPCRDPCPQTWPDAAGEGGKTRGMGGEWQRQRQYLDQECVQRKGGRMGARERGETHKFAVRAQRDSRCVREYTPVEYSHDAHHDRVNLDFDCPVGVGVCPVGAGISGYFDSSPLCPTTLHAALTTASFTDPLSSPSCSPSPSSSSSGAPSPVSWVERSRRSSASCSGAG